jgi:hypothetical protein
MPNKRAADQTLIGFALNRELLRALDLARKPLGQNRSDFIRLAIADELRNLGITVSDAATRAPDRVRKVRYVERVVGGVELNEPSEAAAPQGRGRTNGGRGRTSTT